MNDKVKKIVDIAESWKNRSIYSEKDSPQETCAFFVRYVFRYALHNAGIMPVAHFRPYYKKNGIPQLDTNENFADGLAGDQIGFTVDRSQMQPGDLLFFKDTYRGQFPAGSITHVGICVGSGGLMADSSGGDCHVRNYKTVPAFSNNLVEVRRPRCLEGANAPVGTGISLNKGQVRALHNGRSNGSQEIKIQYGQGAPFKFGMPGRQISIPNPVGLQVLVDGKSVPAFKFVTVDIAIHGQSSHVKLFYHNGQTRAYIGGRETKNLEVVAKFQGALHVWVEGKEVKPTAVNIGIS